MEPHKVPLIVIPTYIRTEQDYELTYTAISTAMAYSRGDILVVDDCSPFGDALDRLDSAGIEVIRKDEQEGFSATVNIGMGRAYHEDRDVILCNADIEFTNDEWLDALYACKGDIVGGLLLFKNALIQHAGIYFSLHTRNFDHRYKYAPYNLEQALRPALCPVSAALQLIKWEVMDEVGFYDEDLKMGWEDVKYAIDAEKRGFKSVYTPNCQAVHHESMFRGNPDKKIKQWNRESWITFHSKLSGDSFKWIPMMLGENSDGCKAYRQSFELRK